MAYPKLVSGGVSKRHKFNGLVKVGASKGVIRVDFNKNMAGGFPGNQKTPLDTPLPLHIHMIHVVMFLGFFGEKEISKINMFENMGRADTFF